MAKVAVITRTKDRPVFLKRAIESVRNQTYGDYQHVIVNDGGDRESVSKIIDGLDNNIRSKIKLIHRKESSNAPDTIFTESVDSISSEYVVIHDDDDTWHPEFLKITAEYLDNNLDIGGVVVRTEKIIEELKPNGSIAHLKSTPWLDDMKVVSLYRQCAENQLTPISFIYRRSAYEAAGKYDDSLPVAGDWEFGIRFLLQYEVDFIDPGFVLAYYHHRKFKPGSQGNTSYAGNDKHRYYTNLIRNSYLRQELKTGKLGPGYIMSKIRYNQTYSARMIRNILPNFITRRLKRRLEY